MERSFMKWVKLRENQGSNHLYDAREGIKNLLSSMRVDPYQMISGIGFYLNKVQENPQATQIIRELMNVGSAFLNEIRNRGLLVYNRPAQGNVSKPEVPIQQGQPGREQYLELVQKYEQKMWQLWKGLNNLLQQSVATV